MLWGMGSRIGQERITAWLLGAAGLYISGVLAFTVMLWQHNRDEVLADNDTTLQLAVRTLHMVLPDGYRQRAVHATAIDPAEFERVQRVLNDYSGDIRGLLLLGTAVQDGADWRVTASNLQELPYWQALPLLHEASPGTTPLIQELTASPWGRVRLCLLTETTGNGQKTAVFAVARYRTLLPRLSSDSFLGLLAGGYLALLAMPLFWTVRLLQERQRAAVEAATLATDRAQLREERLALELQRYQLTPHFLFNSLNSICALIPLDAGRAEQMTLCLSRFCRAGLYTVYQEDTFLVEELELARDYLAIEQVRWGERLQVKFDLDAEVSRSLRVPPLILQPLLENAVKYGPKSAQAQIFVVVRVAMEESELLLEVRNSGQWLDTEANEHPECGAGFGLHNLRRRLDAYYGPGEYLREHHTFAPDWVVMRMRLPVNGAKQ